MCVWILSVNIICQDGGANMLGTCKVGVSESVSKVGVSESVSKV